jgi:hypothetical protein
MIYKILYKGNQMTNTITLLQASQLALNAMEDLITKVEEGSAKSFNICTEFAMVAGSLRAALAQQAPHFEEQPDGTAIPVDPSEMAQQAGQCPLTDCDGLLEILSNGCKRCTECSGVFSTEAPQFAQQAEQGWQPIETAPRETLIFIGGFIDGKFKFGKSEMFYEQANEFAGETFSGWVWSEDEFCIQEPTHWMPLPAAPKGGAA